MKSVIIRSVKSLLCRIFILFAHLRKKQDAIPCEQAKERLMQHSADPQSTVICNNQICEPITNLTIIIPVYNAEQYLEECIHSVLNQKTHYQYNVLAVDDGSTDRSGAILDALCDENLVVVHQENRGISAARNVGLRTIRSDYIMFVDSDDVLPYDAVESLLNKAYTLDADIVQGSYYEFDQKQKYQYHRYADCDHVPPNGVLTGMPWGKVYKAKLFEKICFPVDYWFEDTIITGIITHIANKIATISNVVYQYRLHNASITKTSSGKPKSIDTLWITLCTLSAREKLGMKTDCRFYEHILRQVVLNYKRTRKEPESVRYCIFAVTKDMLEQQRKNQYFQIDKIYAELETAILSGDYARYSVICRFW